MDEEAIPEVSQVCQLLNQKGIHARSAAQIVKTAQQFSATTLISCGEHQVSALSILGLMMLSARQGATIEISASGPQSQACVEALCQLIQNRFGEDL
jgi:phosphocarrier protein